MKTPWLRRCLLGLGFIFNASRAAAAPPDFVALDPQHRNDWHERSGTWTFGDNELAGSGDSTIELQCPFEPPFTLNFHITVLSGERPRIKVGSITLANEGSKRTFQLIDHSAHFAYKLNQDYAVVMNVRPGGVVVSFDGNEELTVSKNVGAVPVITFRTGDGFSKGKSHFTDIVIHPLAAAAATAIAPAPVMAPGDLAKYGDLVKANRGNLVFVNSEKGAGSGFLLKIGAANYLVTNAHVEAALQQAAAFKTLDGSAVPATLPVLAVGHDIFCMTVAAGGQPFELMNHVDANATIGDDVVVLGNAEGAGVVTPIPGKILGIGPDLVEVDAPFVPGNSGSPIVQLKTGKVIGVATYTVTRRVDPATDEPIKDPVVRRFGYRIDSVKSWQPVKWNVFAAEATQMESVEKLTQDLANLLTDIDKNHKITRSLHTNPVIQEPIDIWFAEGRKRMSESDQALSNQNFVARLKAACQADLTDARSRMTYDYFRHKLDDEQHYRDSLTEAFAQILFESRSAGKKKSK